MKMLHSIFLIFLFAAVGYGRTILTGKVLKFDKNELKIELTLENKSSESIYVATNPQQLYGELGYYLLLDETDNSVLQVSSRVYPPPPFLCTYVDKRWVELKKLKSGEEYSESIFIKLPTKETRPPNYGNNQKKVIAENIKQVKLTIGYFFDEKGIVEFLRLKYFGWYIGGQEIISTGKYKDKSFLEIQNLPTIYIPVE